MHMQDMQSHKPIYMIAYIWPICIFQTYTKPIYYSRPIAIPWNECTKYYLFPDMVEVSSRERSSFMAEEKEDD